MTEDIKITVGEDSIIFPTPPIRYCPKCGAEMRRSVFHVLDKWGAGYDSNTGKKILFLRADYRCPNKKHWWDNHEARSAEYCTDTARISISHAVASSGWQ